MDLQNVLEPRKQTKGTFGYLGVFNFDFFRHC